VDVDVAVSLDVGVDVPDDSVELADPVGLPVVVEVWDVVDVTVGVVVAVIVDVGVPVDVCVGLTV